VAVCYNAVHSVAVCSICILRYICIVNITGHELDKDDDDDTNVDVNESCHTATHCSTLQHVAIHNQTLQHTATHCNTLQPVPCIVNITGHRLDKNDNEDTNFDVNESCHTATHLQHTATHCHTLQRTATHCNALQHTTTCSVQCQHHRSRTRP